MKKRHFLFLIFLLFSLAGCASFTAERISQSLERPEDCESFLSTLDERVDRSGVRDAASYPIPGFPYLRANRFLSFMKDRTDAQGGREQWTLWMQKLDLEARQKEINNLPDGIISSFPAKQGAEPTRSELYDRVKSCSDRLFQHDKTRPGVYEMLNSVVEVPEEYSFTMRAIGLYPLVAIPIAVLTDRSRKRTQSWFETNLENLPVDGRLRSFTPPTTFSLGAEEIQTIIDSSTKNPLGIPLLDENAGKKIVERFAPVFVQDVMAPYDRIGRLVWNGECPDVDQEKPTVYYYFSNSFLKGRPILQINYVIWFSERAGKKAPGIERGHLDGLTLRVSLDERGKPFMVDIVNDCGCYHLFSPERTRVDQIISKPLKFDPFVPQCLPDLLPDQRLGVRLNSGWHQVQRLIAGEGFPAPIPYELVPYDVLEVLPREDGRTESIFNSKGIAKCSKRVERFILFSMGIPKIGSMRQRGHHAIELIGRSQFDDPILFDESFIFK
ncbi:MAG TPA: hypothetical protein VLZ10_13860 [Thermodesulfobacteriota bacterium]|nr:hypothetical protein [Thermodesulfobacteriota bacterium]